MSESSTTKRTDRHLPPAEWVVRGIDEYSARAFLKRYEPWRMELKFDSGPKASDGPVMKKFNSIPLNKLRSIMNHIPHEDMIGASVLDVGFNAGYNSLYLAEFFDARVTGIDIVPKHKSVAEELARMIGVEPEFLLASAEEFEREAAFDLVLHLGTLYHLPNPVRSFERCARSLKPGGRFALETICYRASPDPHACKWIPGFRDDHTNCWALGEGAIQSFAQRCGIIDFRMIVEAWPKAYGKEMSRVTWLGRKAN